MTKVIIYPLANETIEQLKQQGVGKVDDYGSYWVATIAVAQADTLKQTFGDRIVEANYLNRIELNALSLDTTANEPAIPDYLKQTDTHGKYLRLIQFKGPVKLDWLNQVKSARGVRVVSYVPNNAYVLWLDSEAEQNLYSLLNPQGPIQWIGPYHPYYKTPQELRSVHGNAPIEVRVGVVPDTSAQTASAASRFQTFGSVKSSAFLNGQEIVQMSAEPSVVIQLAQLPDVLWIEKVVGQRILDEVQDLVAAGQTNQLPFFSPIPPPTGIHYLDFLTNTVGGGLASIRDPNAYPVVDVSDTGVDNGADPQRPVGFRPFHPSFYFLGKTNNSSRIVYTMPPWLGGDPQSQLGCTTRIVPAEKGAFRTLETADLDGHGTFVASILAGYDNGTNINALVNLALQTTSMVRTQLIPHSDDAGNLIECPTSGTANVTISFDTGVTNVCFGTHVFTNFTVSLSSTGCAPFVTNILFTQVATVTNSEIRTSFDGFQFGMGISPFGRIGVQRVWGTFESAVFSISVVDTICTPQFFATSLCLNDLISLASSPYNNSARIQNNSWADVIDIHGVNGGVYNAECQTIDANVRDAVLSPPGAVNALNQEFIVVFACNSSLNDAGSRDAAGGFVENRVTAPATAKNVISVGSAVNPDFSCGANESSQNIPNFSAAGRMADGRFKPEIVAPGAFVVGARNQLEPSLTHPFSGLTSTNCQTDQLIPLAPDIISAISPGCLSTQTLYTSLYECRSGSSYAAPAVSGAIQLLWWYFEHRLTNEVGKALSQPSPAMAKAYLCNSARYLPITNPQTGTKDTLPSILQGMGELDMGRMFDGGSRVLRDESSPRALDVPLASTNRAPQQTYFTQSGQTYELQGTIRSNGVPFRTTLAWLDAPGIPFANKELMNDLDLQVTVGGVTYKGNVFSEDHAVSGGGFDTVNNMESVFFTNGQFAAGTPYTVVVRATTIAAIGVTNVGPATVNQDFALVVYNSGTGTFGTPLATSDSPNLATNDTCQSAIIISNAFFSFTNTLTTSTYSDVHPSPSAGRGGIEEFFKLPVPNGGTPITIISAGTNAVTSIWRGNCGSLEEVSSSATVPAVLNLTADGTNDYYVIVDGKNGGEALVELNISVTCPIITISPASLPSGSIGQLYSQTLTATNGIPPYTFAKTSGSFPPGLFLSDSGVLSGVPTVAGSFTFTVTVTDANGCTGTITYTLLIKCPTITLLPASFPGTTIGGVYNQSSSASGGTAPYTFAVTGGTLPPGLTYSSSGVLSGTATTAGRFDFTITVTDSVGCTASRSYSITVGCSALTILPQTLPNATIATPYSQTLSANGGNGTITFSRTSGVMPPGLDLTSSGVITGTPTVRGVFTFQVTVTDAANCQGSRNYILTVGCPVFAVTPAALPFGNVGAPYNQTLTASGGTAPYTITQTGGSLPAGLTLSSTVTDTATISGVPTSGSSVFTLTVQDASGCKTNFVYTLILANNCPGITASPSTLPDGAEGVAYNQALTGSGGTVPYTFAVYSGALPAGLTLSSAGTLSGTPVATGSFTITIACLDAMGCAGLQTYTLNIACATITVLPSASVLATGTVGLAYSQSLTATGGIAPHSFAVTGGNLPDGLDLTSDGALSGSPTNAGTFAFTVTATDTVSCTGSQLYSLTINPATDLAVSKTASPNPTIVGSNVTYTIVVTNLGPSTATSVTVTDALPSSVTFVSSSSGCIATGGVFACNLGSLASGASTTITIIAAATAEATITNTVSVFSTSFDFNTSNNTATISSDVGAVILFGASAQIVSANAGSAVIRVSRLGETPDPITVQYATADNTAVAGVDYSATAGSLTFGPGITSQTFGVPILASSGKKQNKTSKSLKLVLGNVSGAKLGNPDVATIDIVGSPIKTFTDADGDIVTVKLSGPGSMQVSLSGNGTGPIDQIALSGTTAKSKLSVTVKRGRHGDGFVNLGSIVAQGSLKSISAVKAKVVGTGISVSGSVGRVRINGEKKSKIAAPAVAQ